MVDRGSGSFLSMRSANGGRGISVHAALKLGADHSACCTGNFGEV
jgi:hypothetical protein